MIDDSAGSESGGSDLVLLGPRVPGRVGEPGALLGALVEPLFITNPGNPTAINLPNGVATLVGAITVEVEEYLAGARRRCGRTGRGRASSAVDRLQGPHDCARWTTSEDAGR